MAALPVAQPATSPAGGVLSIPPAPTGTRAQLCDALLRETLAQGKRVILYDGICLVCSWVVNFVVDHDAHARLFTFAPLQSELGAHIIARKEIPMMDSLLLIEPATKGVAPSALERAHWYCRSTAMLHILASLQPRYLFGLLWVLLLVPLFLRDTAYKLFASSRYKLFGTIGSEQDDAASCRPVTRNTRWRFLEYQLRDMAKQAAAEHKQKDEAAAKEPKPAMDSAAVFAAAAAVSAASAALSTTAAEEAESSLGGVSTLVPDAIRAQTDREMLAEHHHEHEHAHALATATSEEELETDAAVAAAAEVPPPQEEAAAASAAPSAESKASAPSEPAAELEEGAKKRKKHKKKGAH